MRPCSGAGGALLDPGGPRDVNQALMDLGAGLHAAVPPAGSAWRLPVLPAGDPAALARDRRPQAPALSGDRSGRCAQRGGEVLLTSGWRKVCWGACGDFLAESKEWVKPSSIARELKEELGIAVTVGDQRSQR